MTELHDLQSEFVTALFDPLHAPPRDVTSYTSQVPGRRFDVYRNNIILGLTELLSAYFPAIARLLGEQLFLAVSRDYIRDDPPRSPVLSRYGGGFPGYISQHAAIGDLPYLADVARLEWLQQRAYHSADRNPVAAVEFENIRPHYAPDIILELHPSAGIIASPYPFLSIWRTNSYDDEVVPINLDAGGEAALVLRSGLEVKVIPLSEGAQAFVRALRARVPLGEAAAYAVARDDTFDFRLAFATLVDSGAFVDVGMTQNDSANHRGSPNHERSRRNLH